MTAREEHPRDTRRLPGDPGIWVLIGGDMAVFSLFFLTFLTYRNASLPLYDQAQAVLNVRIGLINTVLLLTSSWFVAQAVGNMRADRPQRASRLLGLAFLCGLGFAGLKVIEYREKVVAGIDLGTNEFFMFYFMLTGIHLLHVLVGLGVLAGLRFKARGSARPTTQDIALFECGATFWHLVDVLWIVLFPLLYLMK